MSCASSGHITKLKQSIFASFDIYELEPKEGSTEKANKINIRGKNLKDSDMSLIF
jgi:hypothetical protein